MPSRSVSFWSIAGASLLLAAALAEPRAFATLTIVPVRADGTEMKNRVGTGTTFYYPLGLTQSSTLFLDSGDSTMPPSVLNQDGNNGGANETEAPDSTSNAIFFKITSDKTFTVTGTQVLAVTVKAAGSSSSNYVPISVLTDGTNKTSCAKTTTCYVNQKPSGSSTNALDASNFSPYFFAAPFTSGGSTIIGLYPFDICYGVYKVTGQTLTGCSTQGGASYPTANVTGTTNPLQLTFNIEVLPDRNTLAASPPAAGTGPVETGVNITLAFESTGPSFSCPSFTDIYKPGDQTIFLNTNDFSATTGTNAPLSTLIVVAKDGSAPNATSTFESSGNDNVQRVPVGAPDQAVTGFTNTSASLSDHNYQVSFMARDAAGMVAAPASGSCVLGSGGVGVQTAAINGFLKKSSCFIATAAYRSADVAPVRMLREFRDRVLLPTAWGRAFTHWYYGWSPPAAEWLMDHPAFRFPVLLALVPVELIAWGSLHPTIIAAILICSAIGFFAARVSRRGRT